MTRRSLTIFPFSYFALLLFFFLAFSTTAEVIDDFLPEAPALPQPQLRERMISKYVVILLSKYHYNPQVVNPAISAEWFAEYFNSLDFNRSLFLETDLDAFRSFESVLWDQRTMNANLDFPFKVYQRFLERIRQRAIFARETVQQEFDFSKEEFLQVDEKEQPWCQNEQELKERWRKQIKNAILANKLQEEKEAAKKKNKQNKEKQAATDKNQTAEQSNSPAAMTFPERLVKNYARSYVRRAEVEAINILEIYLTSLARVIDPHSAYMAPETKENFDISMRLSLEGIGATLSTKDAYTVVVSIVPGGPADRDGRLKEGDRITAVAQEGEEAIDVIEMPLNKVVSKIRGPKGTTVHLTILEEGASTSTLVSLVRDEVKLTDQEAQSEIRQLSLPDDQEAQVLIVYLPSFYADFGARAKGDPDYKSSARDVRKLIEEASRNHPLDGVILDLRGNGGGALDEAVDLTGLFIPTGPVVQVKDNSGHIERKEDKDASVTFTGPLVVMVDKLSASASEIVAGALQDYSRALIVGDQSTHGKGTVQSVINLANVRALATNKPENAPGSLKLTISQFYRINGSSTQVEGVNADIAFPSFLDQLDLGEDKLPHVMPWDQIDRLKYANSGDVAALLPQLQEASKQRLQKSTLYREYLEDIDLYANFRATKQLPLEINARRQYQEQEEKSIKMFRKFQAQRKKSRKKSAHEDKVVKDDDEEAPADAQDLILEETVNIMADYIRLNRQQGYSAR